MNNLEKKFEKMGARVKIETVGQTKTSRSQSIRWRLAFGAVPNPDFIRLDVGKDKEGTFFDLRAGTNVDLEILDIKPKDRHLLLMARNSEGKSKFLCGHDERDWFVAAIPEKSSASSVASAMEALKPEPVKEAQSKKGLNDKEKKSRKTEAYRRQGEWFFIPCPNLKVDKKLILKDEPLQRGRSKPHMAEFLYRIGGQTVWVSSKYPNGLTKKQYEKLDKDERTKGVFRQMVRDAKIYVKGKIRHSDHKTIELSDWCEVQLNTETEAKAMKNVAFLD
jgi:hypothetical protein